MKKILLYEAFKAKSIVKTIGYLKKAVADSDAASDFISALRSLKDKFDISIDKIDDQYLDYMSKRDALVIKGKTENVDDPDGIYCLKFWFSTDSGYLGYSGTGNTEIPYIGSEFKFQRMNAPTPRALERIGITTGQVIPLNGDNAAFEELKTGDKIVGYFSDGRRDSRFALATVFVEKRQDSEGRTFIYALQDVSDSLDPETEGWREYGKYSHLIFMSDDGVRYDNRDICRYINDGSTLTIGGQPAVDKADMVFCYNLPLDSNGEFQSWGNGSMYKENLDKADFAIILYLDELKKNSKDKPSELKSYREKSREGSYSFLSNDIIKQANLERYVAHIAKSIGISPDSINLMNLQKLPQTLLCGKFALITVKSSRLDDHLENLINYASSLVSEFKDYEESEAKDDSALIHYYNRFINYFSKMRNNSSYVYYYRNFNACISHLDASTSENREIVKDLFNITIRIGEKIQANLNKEPITSLTNIKMFRYKLQSIRNAAGSDEFEIDGRLDDWFDNLPSSNTTYATHYTDKLLNSDVATLNRHKDNLLNLEAYIDSILPA